MVRSRIGVWTLQHRELTCTPFVDFQSDDPELEAIRQRRMAELMARSGQVGTLSHFFLASFLTLLAMSFVGTPITQCMYNLHAALQGPMSAEDQQRQEEAKAAAEDQRQAMLAALLHSSARERRK